MRNITYGISDNGFVISRIGSEVAFWIMKSGFEKMSIFESNSALNVYWTKKIPTPIKNIHRKFWGLPLLPGSNIIPKQGYVLYAKGTINNPSKLIVKIYNEAESKMMGEKDWDVVAFSR